MTAVESTIQAHKIPCSPSGLNPAPRPGEARRHPVLRLVVLLALACEPADAARNESGFRLVGSRSGQVIPPHTCTADPLVVRLDPPESGSETPVRFRLISVPSGASGYAILSEPTGTQESRESLDRLPSPSGETYVWLRVGDREGAYILTAEHPQADNVVTFFVHARRRLWKYLIPVPVLLGLALAAWGLYRLRNTTPA